MQETSNTSRALNAMLWGKAAADIVIELVVAAGTVCGVDPDCSVCVPLISRGAVAVAGSAGGSRFTGAFTASALGKKPDLKATVGFGLTSTTVCGVPTAATAPHSVLLFELQAHQMEAGV